MHQLQQFLANFTSSTSRISSYNPGSTSSQVWETGLKNISHFELLLLQYEEVINEVHLSKLLDADDYEQSKMEAFLLRDRGTNLKLFLKCVLLFWSLNSKQQQRVRQRIFKLLSSSSKLAASFDSASFQKELLKLVLYSIIAAKFRQECSSALELMVSNDAFLNALSEKNFLQELLKTLNFSNSAVSFFLFCCGVRQKLPEGEKGAVERKESPEFVKQLVRLAQKQKVIEAVVDAVERTPLAAEMLEAILSSDQSSPIVEHTRTVLRQNKNKWFKALSQGLKYTRLKLQCASEEEAVGLSMAELWTRVLTLYIGQSKDFDFELGEIFTDIDEYPNSVLLHLLDLAALLCTMKGGYNKLKMERILVNTFRLLSIPPNKTVSDKLVTIFTAAASRPKIDLLEHVLHDCQLLYYFAESCEDNNSLWHPFFLEIGIRFIYLSRISEKFGNSCEQHSRWQDIQHSELFKSILKQVLVIDRNSRETKTYEVTTDCPEEYVMILFEYDETKETHQVSHELHQESTTVRPFELEPISCEIGPTSYYIPFPVLPALPAFPRYSESHVPPQDTALEILESLPMVAPHDTKHYSTEWRKVNEEISILVLKKSRCEDQ